MTPIRAITVAAVGCCLSAAMPASALDLGALTKISGNNIDFYYDATVYQSASVSGDELQLGLALDAGEGMHTFQQVVAIAHSGLSLRADVGTRLSGSFDVSPYTSVDASNSLAAYGASYVGGQLALDGGAPLPLNHVQQSYRWDAVSYSYQGDFSSSIFPQTESNGRPDLTVAALVLNGDFLLSLGNTQGSSAGSSASVNSVSYSFLTATPGDAPPVPEPATYAMLLAGLGVLGWRARRARARAR